MIMKGGLTALLRGFSAPIKDAFKISHLELGNDTGGEDPPVPIGYNTPLSEFNKVYTMQLSHEDFSVVDYKTLKLELSLDGSEMIEDEDGFLKFSSIRLVCGNGEVFAWRRFTPSILVSGYVATLEWDIVLDEVCWNGGVIDPPETPEHGYFKVKTTSGEVLELDLTNTEQVTEWIEKEYISVHPWVNITQLKVKLSTVEEVISYGGPQIHTENGVFNISGYQLGTPNLIKIPDYLPEWVTNMSAFLQDASKFNQPLDNLDTSNVTSMAHFLRGATKFNSTINLDTSNVTDMSGFLSGASSFNQPLDNLDTSKVTNMNAFSRDATSFNQPLNLNTSNVTSMYWFLADATSFNQPINLDTSNVTEMISFLAGATSFNQPLNLDTSNVTNMGSFLSGASSFNQDLSHLCVPLIKSEPYNFATGATAYTEPRPIWGTCPGENPTEPETPDHSNFKVKTTDGEVLELDLTNTEQVTEWLGNNYISTIEFSSGGVTTAQLKVELSTVEEVISYGGPQIHTENGVKDISGYRLGTPNLIKIPDYLPEWVTNMESFLRGATSFNSPLNLDTSNVTNMSYFLYNATSFNSSINLDTSKVTNMSWFLYGASSFNQPLDNLDTSNVTNMSNFLRRASSFNQPLNLDTSNVTDMSYFFYEATSFNQPLNLDTSNVTDMSYFLRDSTSFNQPLELDTSNVTDMSSFLEDAKEFNSSINLDTSKVTDMSNFLRGASSFNQPLNLDTGKVTSMGYFLFGATRFNSPLNLDTSNVTDMSYFFYEATSFNQPLNLDTSNVTNMGYFLYGASSFNRTLDNLNTSNVTDMGSFFYEATSFNQPLNLDTSKVTNMSWFLYKATSFNQPLDNLDTSNVTNMDYFLYGATSFNQDLSHLCVPLITEEPRYFATGATAYTKPRPVWGTCPGKE